MIQLQPFTVADYDRLILWVDSAESLMQFAGPGFVFPLTHQQLDDSLSDSKRKAFKVVDVAGNATIGHAEIYLTTEAAHFGRILIGDEKQRGKGIGQMIVAQLLHIAFEEMNQSLATLNVFDWNLAAIKCYEKGGFAVNPDKRLARTVNGKTWTALNMVLPKEVWQRMKASSSFK